MKGLILEGKLFKWVEGVGGSLKYINYLGVCYMHKLKDKIISKYILFYEWTLN